MHDPVAHGSGRGALRSEALGVLDGLHRWAFGVASAFVLAAATPAWAADISVSKAWVPPSDAAGADVIMSMTVKNDGAEDSIVRARCPFANFVEKQTVDIGEGGTSNRTIKSIPIPAKSTLEMTPKGYHLMLLQTTEKLSEGGKYTCSVTFKVAGPTDVEVKVAKAPPAS